MPTELELIALNTEFDLYLPFLKRLVLNLPMAEDRCRAAQWLQKLRTVTEPNSMKLRNEHLKLLLFALHRRSLVGVFGVKPPPDELESFHDGLTLLEMTRELIELTEKKKTQSDSKESPLPKVMTGLSYDMKEYVAAQMIPKFGSHCFYAISKEPLQFWSKSGFGHYPGMNAQPNPFNWENAISKISDGILESQAALDQAIENAKLIEAGLLDPDEADPPIDFKKKITVPICKGGGIGSFKWKKDSLLNIYLELDTHGTGTFDDLESQGKAQLEVDEDAFKVLDDSLPGRRRIVIRDPYFNDVPGDLSERRLHGVLEGSEYGTVDGADNEEEPYYDEGPDCDEPAGYDFCACNNNQAGPCSAQESYDPCVANGGFQDGSQQAPPMYQQQGNTMCTCGDTSYYEQAPPPMGMQQQQQQQQQQQYWPNSNGAPPTNYNNAYYEPSPAAAMPNQSPQRNCACGGGNNA